MSYSVWGRWVQRALAKMSNRKRLPVRRRLQPWMEGLEVRCLLTAAYPSYILEHGAGSNSLVGNGPGGGYTPSQISQAYGTNLITFAGGIQGNGAGETIAIVDAYDDPNIVSSTAPGFSTSDLHVFEAQYNLLPDPGFTKVNQTGGSAMPVADSNWSVEISLDVEWARAVAPAAKILLVEASTNNFSDLLTAVQYAASRPGVVAVSMSWGGTDFSGEQSYDSYFVPPSSNPGVVFVASTGDTAAPPVYPGTSPNVLGIGGTTLNLTTQNNWSSETGWAGSGGGISVEAQPAYQKGIVTQSTTYRTSPDVSIVADPNTGLSIYDSYQFSGWTVIGGTSCGAPQWAALVAIADQGRALDGETALAGPTQLLPLLYQFVPASDFHDITGGTSSGTPNYSASQGYDLVTGRGTPKENLIVSALVNTDWSTFGSNPQHTGLSVTQAQPLNAIRWQTVIDQQPGGSEHYGSPIFTSQGTVIVPIKTGATGSFQLEGINAATGSVLWTVTSDYTEPAYASLPPFQPVYDPTSNRVYFPGNGGTIYYVINPDSSGATIGGQLAFYGLGNYQANPGVYNSSVFIDTPLTVDTFGNIFFGVQVTGLTPAGPSAGGIARISAAGVGTFESASSASGDSNVNMAALGSAPALSGDGTIVYAAVVNSTNQYDAYLVGLNSSTLAPVDVVLLKDPSTGSNAGVNSQSTSAPMVAPDGTVFFGVLGNPSNDSRGFLLHFSANLSQSFTPGAFGWDDTPSLVPATMVPSYKGSSTYLILSKYNNYAASGADGGNGINEMAILDPYASQPDPNNDGNTSLQVMAEIQAVAGPTRDTTNLGTYPNAVLPWSSTSAPVSLFTGNVYLTSADGYVYCWNLSSNTLTQAFQVGTGVGHAYTATAIGPDGTVYAASGGTLFALGGLSNYTMTDVSFINPIGTGDSATFTTTLASTSGGPTPTGTIIYYDGTTRLQTVPLAGGIASYTNSSLAAGQHFIVASYSGDSNYAPSTVTLVQSIITATATAVVSSLTPAHFGQVVTITATVTASGSSPNTLAGQVTFMDGSTVLGVASVNASGQASYTTSTLAPGSHTISATYGLDPNFVGSTSNSINEVIQASTATSASNVSAVYNEALQQVTVSASVTSAGGTVSAGTVSFSIPGLGTANNVSVINGVASTNFSVPGNSAVGSYAITASYSGTAGFLSSSDNAHTITISQATTSTSGANLNTAYNQSAHTVTITATVTSSAGTINVGTLNFSVAGLGSVSNVSIINGLASTSFTVPAGTAVGAFVITATYSGTTNLQGSTNNTHSLNVIQAATTTTESNVSTAYSLSSHTVTLTATISSGAGTISVGTVNFSVAGLGSVNNINVTGGVASTTFTVPASTAAGTYAVTAAYSGNTNLLGSSDSSHSVTIAQATTTTTASNVSTAYSLSAHSVTLTANVSSGAGTVGVGTVNFSVAGLGSVNNVTVAAGVASASFTIPAGTAVGSHVVTASYSGNANFQSSSDNTHTVSITQAATSVEAAAQSANFSSANQAVTLSATVSSAAGGNPSVGTVTFSVFNGLTQIGSSATSGTVASGAASAVFTLPANTPAGAYAIHVSYSGAGNFAGSNNSGDTTFPTLTVNQTSSVVDNGQPGYSETGTGWTSYTDPNAFNGNERVAAPGTGANTAAWQVNTLAVGIYNVEVDWTAYANRATNATYQVFDGANLLATLQVNQQVAPTGGAISNGTQFQNLGRFTISSGTLKVVLSDNANGYVIADAMLVQTPTLPSLVDNSQYGYSDNGSGWMSFSDPSAELGNERYVAPGTGANTATWQAPGLSAGLYDVEIDWTAFANRATNASYQVYDGATLLATLQVNQQLTPTGGSTIGGVPFQSLGRFTVNSGTLKVVLSDNANGYVIADGLLVQATSLPVVVDNSQYAYSESGSGWASAMAANAYFGNERYVAPGTGANTATWQVPGLAAGEYDVEVDWTAFANRATNASYQVYDGTTLLATLQVNQQLVPIGGATVGGVPFQSLGRFAISSGTLKVVVSDNANGYVIADAVFAQMATTPAAVDNSAYGYSETGTGWSSFADPSAYLGNERYAAPGTGGNTATWQVPGLSSGTYNVETTWTAYANRATNATYQVFDGATLLGTVMVNQQLAPAGGATVGGVAFQSLGHFAISSGTLRVVLTDNANAYVIADAIYVM
jgi:hypothetical protein